MSSDATERHISPLFYEGWEEVEPSVVVYVNKTFLIIPVKPAQSVYSHACGIFGKKERCHAGSIMDL